jgi:predicted DNA binding protein
MGQSEYIRLTVDARHPDCWTLAATNNRDAGLIGYGTTSLPGQAHRLGYYTVFGDSRESIDAVIDAIRGSEQTGDVFPHAVGIDVASVSRNVVVETNPDGGLRDEFRSRGYLHLGPTYHRDDRERRTLVTRADRRTVERTLREIGSACDADVELRTIASAPFAGSSVAGSSTAGSSIDRLSPRQREAFLLARERGYYEYPREVDSASLAETLDISKTTLLEHLRKAERKLLTNVAVGEDADPVVDVKQ